MSEMTVESVKRIPRMCGVLLAVAIVCSALAIANPKQASAYFAVAIIAVLGAVFRYLIGSRPFAMTFADEHFTVFPEYDSVRYDEIVAIRRASARGKSSSYPLDIVLKTRTISVPPDLTVPTAQIEACLCEKATFDRQPSDERLAKHLAAAVAQFSEDRVWWTVGVMPASIRRSVRGTLYLSLFLFVAGVLGSMVGDFWKDHALRDACIAVACCAFGLAVIALLTKLGGVQRNIPFRTAATVIVTPKGLIVSQVNLLGEVRWDEIRGITHVTGGSFRLSTTTPATSQYLQLRLPGTSVRILDIYDRSLQEIHERMLQYWQ